MHKAARPQEEARPQKAARPQRLTMTAGPCSITTKLQEWALENNTENSLGGRWEGGGRVKREEVEVFNN